MVVTGTVATVDPPLDPATAPRFGKLTSVTLAVTVIADVCVTEETIIRFVIVAMMLRSTGM